MKGKLRPTALQQAVIIHAKPALPLFSPFFFQGKAHQVQYVGLCAAAFTICLYGTPHHNLSVAITKQEQVTMNTTR